MQKLNVAFMFAAVLATSAASATGTHTPPPPPPAPVPAPATTTVKVDNANTNLNANLNLNAAKANASSKSNSSAKSNSKSNASSKSDSKSEVKNSGNSKSKSEANVSGSGNSSITLNTAQPANQTLTYGGSYKVKNTADVNLGGPASGPCNGFSGGASASIPGLALGANASTVDKGCERREMIRVALMAGRTDIANDLLEDDPMVLEMKERKKQRAEQAARGVPMIEHPEVTDPYVRMRLGYPALPATR